MIFSEENQWGLNGGIIEISWEFLTGILLVLSFEQWKAKLTPMSVDACGVDPYVTYDLHLKTNYLTNLVEIYSSTITNYNQPVICYL